MANPDDDLAIRFFLKPVENKNKSREMKRAIFEDREFVEVRFPSDNKRSLVAPADEMHFVAHEKRQMTYAERFGSIYDAFKRNDVNFVSGTPLMQTGLFPPSKCEELKRMNIVTAEQLAGLTDRAIRDLGHGGRGMVEEAIEFLDGADARAQNQVLQDQINALKAQLETQNAPAVQDDPYEGFEDADLVNLIKDAGGKVAKNATRQTMLNVLDEISKEKEDA